MSILCCFFTSHTILGVLFLCKENHLPFAKLPVVTVDAGASRQAVTAPLVMIILACQASGDFDRSSIQQTRVFLEKKTRVGVDPPIWKIIESNLDPSSPSFRVFKNKNIFELPSPRKGTALWITKMCLCRNLEVGSSKSLTYEGRDF